MKKYRCSHQCTCVSTGNRTVHKSTKNGVYTMSGTHPSLVHVLVSGLTSVNMPLVFFSLLIRQKQPNTFDKPYLIFAEICRNICRVDSMYGHNAAYGGKIMGPRELLPRQGPDAPGERSWFHGDKTAQHRGETAAISWHSIPHEGSALPGQRSWFRSGTVAQHRGETTVEGSPHKGPSGPGLTGWYHRKETVPRPREPHRWLSGDSPITTRRGEYHSLMACDPPSIYR